MIAECDFSQLEWRVAAELSRDENMISRILAGVDEHEEVRSSPQFFNGKVERVWAKIFNFRAIYADERTAAYAFYMDPNMPRLAKKTWDKVVASFYDTKPQFTAWHVALYQEVMRSGGFLRTASGREFRFRKYQRGDYLDYKRTQIYNYPVQGTAGGEILPLALVAMRRALRKTQIKFTNTVHDSIIFDLPEKELDILEEVWYNTLRGIPLMYQKLFHTSWIVPLDGEIKVGETWGDVKKLKEKENGLQQPAETGTVSGEGPSEFYESWEAYDQGDDPDSI